MKEYKIFGKELKHNELVVIFWIIGVLVVVMGCLAIYDMITPPVQHETVTLPYGFTIWAGLPTFLAICIGIGWVLHGVGFRIL